MALKLTSKNITPKTSTVVELLRERAMDVPDRTAYVYLTDGELEEVSITYSELDLKARGIAAWLQAHSQVGERALLLYPPGLDYLAAYYGCLYAGVIAVPAYPPRMNRPVPRIQGIVADAQARFALTTSDIYENMEQRFEYAPDLKALNWLDTSGLPNEISYDWKPPKITSDSLAFLQYTSGSTSQPKGVMVSHANLLFNLEQIRVGFHLDNYLCTGCVGVSWLPTYHDMGLIGGILGSMYMRAKMVILSPLAFLQRPLRWLQAISRYNATISGGPNFAYDICLEKVKPEQIEALDLSNWKVAFSGAEPIRTNTTKRFAETFGPCGFKADAFYPCYGLAEATLIVSGGDGPSAPQSIKLSRSALESGTVVQMEDIQVDCLESVNCGRAILDETIIIVHPKELARLPEGRVGEIWVSGPNIAQGYWNRPEVTALTFEAYLADTGEGPFMRTGDLGFIKDGDLYIAGRLKDLIIIRGSNHYPQDIELTVEKSHSACQTGGGAAFSVSVAGSEELVIVQEVTRQARNSSLEEVFQAIRHAVSENHDLQVYAIALIRPMTAPKTSSGKIQRHAAKAGFELGTLDVIQEWRARPVVS